MEQPFRGRRDAFLRKILRHSAVMGILNVTPDSFFDGGQFQTIEAATAQARKLVADGCDIVDIGGESSRPGATPVSAADELARIETIVAQVAAADAIVVIMHNRAQKDETLDIVTDIRRFFDRSLALAAKAGIARERIILDPGIGFAKTSRQNRDALARLGEFKDYGLPIMVGVSRKSFLGSLTPDHPEASLTGTVAANLVAAAQGARIFRVHDVAEHVAALKIFDALRHP